MDGSDTVIIELTQSSRAELGLSLAISKTVFQKSIGENNKIQNYNTCNSMTGPIVLQLKLIVMAALKVVYFCDHLRSENYNFDLLDYHSVGAFLIRFSIRPLRFSRGVE